MPTKAAFKKQADTTHEAPTNFNAICSLNAPGLLAKITLDDLIAATMCYHLSV